MLNYFHFVSFPIFTDFMVFLPPTPILFTFCPPSPPDLFQCTHTQQVVVIFDRHRQELALIDSCDQRVI